MQGFAAVFGVITGLSLTVTKGVDLVRNLPWFKGKWLGSWVWNLLAFVFGVVLCIGWQHSFVNDLFAQIPALSTIHLNGPSGYVLSGLILGGVSGFGHELLDALSGAASAGHARAAQTAAGG
jgi:hypothetical protein